MKGKEKNKIMDHRKGNIKITDKLPLVADDDPVLLRKEQEAIKSFDETPWPDCVLKRIIKED